MGTDELGRDLFARMLQGARVSLFIGFASAIAALLIGSVFGVLCGYYGGTWDRVLMRGIDLFYSLPSILIATLIILAFGRGLIGVVIAVSLGSVASQARLTRGLVLREREALYVEAARALGTSQSRIALFHILPNLLGPLVTYVVFLVPASILTESFLSFMGLGIAPPYASWGSLANDGLRAIQVHPHLILFPGLAVCITVAALTHLGEVLKKRFDPRLGIGQLT